MQLPVEVQREITDIEFLAQAVQVIDQDTFGQAKEVESAANDLKKQVLAVTDPFVKSSYRAWKEQKAEQNGHLKPVERALRIVKDKINAYARQQTQKARDRVSRVAEATGADERDIKVETPELSQGFRKVWKWKVSDTSKIPPRYWTLNESMINSEVRAQKNRTNIPGIEVYEEMVSVAK